MGGDSINNKGTPRDRKRFFGLAWPVMIIFGGGRSDSRTWGRVVPSILGYGGGCRVGYPERGRYYPERGMMRGGVALGCSLP